MILDTVPYMRAIAIQSIKPKSDNTITKGSSLNSWKIIHRKNPIKRNMRSIANAPYNGINKAGVGVIVGTRKNDTRPINMKEWTPVSNTSRMRKKYPAIKNTANKAMRRCPAWREEIINIRKLLVFWCETGVIPADSRRYYYEIL